MKKKKEDVFIGEDYCPCCNKLIDCATEATSDSRPEPGAVSICLYCGAVLIFKENLKVREATAEDLEKLSDSMIVRLTIIKNEILKQKL